MKENNRKAIARRARQRKQRARRVALTLCLIVATMLVSVGGTIAWLTAETDEVKNTFTVGDINIELWENDYVPETNSLDTKAAVVTKNEDYKFVPGVNLPKNPTVTVKADSEACWLFVTVAKSEGWSNKVTYAIDDTVQGGTEGTATKWTELKDGVYYIEVAATEEDVDFNILKGQIVNVSNTIEKGELSGNYTLTFDAYAVQKDQVGTAAAAWAIANPTT